MKYRVKESLKPKESAIRNTTYTKLNLTGSVHSVEFPISTVLHPGLKPLKWHKNLGKPEFIVKKCLLL